MPTYPLYDRVIFMMDFKIEMTLHYHWQGAIVFENFSKDSI